jgi:hypothetical protein
MEKNMSIHLTLSDHESKKLEKIADRSGKSFDEIVKEILLHYEPNASRHERLIKDPFYNIKPSNADIRSDYSSNIDKYLYNN